MEPFFSKPYRLNENVGNNAFGRYPESGNFLDVPIRIFGNPEDVRVADGREGRPYRVAFREFGKDGSVEEFAGLDRFVSTEWNGTPVAVFDNHNFALAFWCEAMASGVFRKGATLAHIDMHSDLWPNGNELDLSRVGDTRYVEDFVNLKTSVGNYIEPARRSGMFDRFVRIEGEGDLRRELSAIESGEYGYVSKTPDACGIPDLVLNLDLDFFAPDLDDVPFELKKRAISEFARRARFVTVATSPCFIDQELAIERLREIFGQT